MFSGRSSRSSSVDRIPLPNIFNKKNKSASNPEDTSRVTPVMNPGWDDIEVAPDQAPGQVSTPPSINHDNNYADDLDSYWGDDPNNDSEEVRYTRNHPLGRQLLSLAMDNTRFAKKANIQAMESNIPNLCADFCRFMRANSDKISSAINCAVANIELGFINKEFNSHKINMSVEAPTYFSPTPVLTTAHQRAEMMKIFPTRHKFSGSMSKEGTMDIIEFLRIVKAAQINYKLSEPEFKEMLLASTTGKPHALLVAWMAHDEDVATIFHNLMIHFDKGISPESAKQQLYEYKAPKGATLAKVEAHIMLLADKASLMLPAGPTRSAYYNLERIQTLIRCLPPISSSLVQSKYNDLSAKLDYAATAAQLSRALNGIRHAIDKDILEHGADRRTKIGPRAPNYKTNSRSYTALSVSQPIATTSPPRILSTPSRNTASNYNSYQNKANNPHSSAFHTSSTRSRSSVHRGRGNFQNNYSSNFQRLGNRDGSGRFASGRRGNNRPHSQHRHNNNNGGYCSLCGHRDHVSSQDCPFMIDNQGKRLKIMPTLGTCNACPAKVNPRLNHPSSLCPYRKGGPLEGSI